MVKAADSRQWILSILLHVCGHGFESHRTHTLRAWSGHFLTHFGHLKITRRKLNHTVFLSFPLRKNVQAKYGSFVFDFEFTVRSTYRIWLYYHHQCRTEINWKSDLCVSGQRSVWTATGTTSIGRSSLVIPPSRTSMTHEPLKLMQDDVLGDQHGGLKIVAQEPSPLITWLKATFRTPWNGVYTKCVSKLSLHIKNWNIYLFPYKTVTRSHNYKAREQQILGWEMGKLCEVIWSARLKNGDRKEHKFVLMERRW